MLKVKSILSSIKRSLCGCVHAIYNPRANTIIYRSPADFLRTCVFFIIFYGLLGLLAVSFVFIFSYLSVDSKKDPPPVNNQILQMNLGFVVLDVGLVSLSGHYDVPKFTDIVSEDYTNYAQAISANLQTYDYALSTAYHFQLDTLEDCRNPPYGMDGDNPCFIFRMAKNSTATQTINIFPGKGFPLAAFPVSKGQLPPPVAVKITRSSEDLYITCSVAVQGMGRGMTGQTPPGSIHFKIMKS
ncbi:hypothetical protein RF11_05837 [Thelohanellus kitauei]|uniref:Uncharacterized protein n=1 Tax=Thelohanellus kitauei TaxID=669202 RepID=A0A0C2I7F2_THEKT|nr:hypothetical protein RF11_05837 [Thelohanellus kitauei]